MSLQAIRTMVWGSAVQQLQSSLAALAALTFNEHLHLPMLQKSYES